MLFPKQHVPHFIFLRIPHPHFIPVIRRATPRRIRLPHGLHPHANLFPQPFQFFQRQHPFHFHQIHLFQLTPALQHFRRQVAVIRQKHQPGRRILQIPYRVHARRKASQTILQRFPPFRVRHRRHNLRRLVQHQVHAPLLLFHHASRCLDPVRCRVRLCPQLTHHVPVHAHLSAQDQLLRVPPRSNPRPRNNLLQSFLHFLVSSFWNVRSARNLLCLMGDSIHRHSERSRPPFLSLSLPAKASACGCEESLVDLPCSR